MLQLSKLKDGPEVAAKLNTLSTNVLFVCCQIQTVIVKDEQGALTGSDVEKVCFDENDHAFKIVVKPFQAVKVVDVQELVYFKPVDVQMAYGSTDSSLYIVPYSHLMQP